MVLDGMFVAGRQLIRDKTMTDGRWRPPSGISQLSLILEDPHVELLSRGFRIHR
jgi:hypothetical protein